MNEIKTLAALELRSLYGINKFKYTKDKKAKNSYKLLSGVWIFLIIMVAFYMSALVYGLCFLDMARAVVTYIALISSAIVFVFGIFKSGGVVFSKKGYEILSSLPIKPRSIVLARFISMYVEDLAVTAVIMLPAGAVFAYLQRPGMLFYPLYIIGIIFVPIIPLVLSLIFGFAVTLIASKTKKSSLWQTVLSLVFVVAVIIISTGSGSAIEDFTAEQISYLADIVLDISGKIYPPALWLGRGVTSGNVGEFLLFAGLSVILLCAATALVSVCFHKIMIRLDVGRAKHNYKIGALEARSLIKTLYIREAKRYFSSSIYVTNTIVGPILGCIMSAVCAFAGVEAITQELPFAVDINGIFPYILSAVFCMMTTTSVSISMEGNRFWIVKSLPIPAKALFDAKILLNLSLMLPFYILSEIFLFIALKPSVTELIALILIPAAFMLFSTVLGITVNLKLHSFDWEKEAAVVKQSSSAMLGGFAGAVLAIGFGLLYFAVPPAFSAVASAACVVILLVAGAVLYRHNNKAELCKL